jgi:uncharacterized membrane protein (UPF0182 family)
VQVYRTINNTAAISKEFSLLNQQGSSVKQGSIQIIPVKDSLLYVQPVYVLSSNGQQPAFRDVIVYYNGTAAIDKTLSGALSQFPAFSGITAPPDTGNATQPPANPSARATVDSLLSDANKAYADAQNALKNQDLAGYQQQVQRLGDLLDQLAKARASEQGSTPSSSTSSTTTTTRAKSSGGTSAAGPSR